MSVGAKTAIIDYGMGNLRSVYRAWEAVGAKARIISSPSEIEGDDLLIFPGQGAVADTMKLLKSTGFDSAIRDWIAAEAVLWDMPRLAGALRVFRGGRRHGMLGHI